VKPSFSELKKKYAFVIYVLLAVLISWLPWYATGSGFFVCGASIAGIITIALTAGKQGMRDLVRRTLRWRTSVLWWAMALLFTGLLVLPAIGIRYALDGTRPSFAFFKESAAMIPVFFLYTLLGGPLGEEFGWRGFALPRLQRKWSPVMASAVIGVVWALWHLPLFFQEDSFQGQMGFEYLPLYLVAEVALATFITWVYNKTKGSLLVGGIIMHNADNFWGVTLLTNATYGMAIHGEGEPILDLRLWVIATIVSAVAAAVLALATKGKLGLKAERVETSS
jgi:membrane protease YdiL (CAAX protease family)